jgi:hypothetical protein
MPPYSDPEPEILQERFPQQSQRPAAVKIFVTQLRMKFSAGSVESRQQQGVPLLRVYARNTRCFIRDPRAAGCALLPKTNTQMSRGNYQRYL